MTGNQQQREDTLCVEGLRVVERTESGWPIYGMEDGIEETVRKSLLQEEVEHE